MNTVIAGARGCQNKHKAHRSRVKAGYYKAQFYVTERNKLRRKVRFKRRMEQFKQAA